MNKFSENQFFYLGAKGLHNLMVSAQESIDITERTHTELKELIERAQNFPSSFVQSERLKDATLISKGNYLTQMIVVSMKPHLDEIDTIRKELSSIIGWLGLLYNEIQLSEENKE